MLSLFEQTRKGKITIGRIGTNITGENYVNIRIDRGHSYLANPFRISGEMTRDICCDKYEDYFHMRKLRDAQFRDAIMWINYYIIRGYNVNLQCHCSPKRCHGETIKNYLEERNKCNH